ncbi:MAG TPA: ABC transporter permease [Solirubrobacteraceae bacterium]|jgi:ABC-2 type transport system permease protein|nr:ABC transporter permease [Solirubrobacteraceae bacterium]
MRWLLIKDIQILRRSPLLVGLLIVYPIVIALLIGFALSRAPDKPRVAVVNEIPSGQLAINVGGHRVDISSYINELFDSVTRVPVSSRAQALADVRSGAALATIVIPADFTTRLSSGLQSAQVEVIYNGDAVEQSFVQSTISAKLSQANTALATQLAHVAGGYVDLLQTGGRLSAFGTSIDVLGLDRSNAALGSAIAGLPGGSPIRAKLIPVARFTSLGVADLGFAKSLLDTIANPIQVQTSLLAGRRTPLNAFAVPLAVAVSLMFVCVLLAAGMLSLEREANTFARLTRGLVSGTGVLIEKGLLSAGCAFVASLAMLCGIGAFVHLDWGRLPLWVVAIAASALAFSALGVAIGSLAREVRAASLLAFLLALPLAFMALVPSGSVSGGLYDVISVVSAVFPFKAGLQAIDASINGSQPGLGSSLPHLAGLIVVFAVAARIGLRRFAR